jgi:hypothetical protein
MQLLADVAGDGFVPSFWDLLWPYVGPCILALVVLAVVGQLVASIFDRLMGNEPAPGRSVDSWEGASSRPEAR